MAPAYSIVRGDKEGPGRVGSESRRCRGPSPRDCDIRLECRHLRRSQEEMGCLIEDQRHPYCVGIEVAS
jgi:hypothetical protein